MVTAEGVASEGLLVEDGWTVLKGVVLGVPLEIVLMCVGGVGGCG